MPSVGNFVRRHFLLVTLAIAIALVIGWYGIKIGSALYVVNETFNVSLARDAKTGQYIGEVTTEIKDKEGEKIMSYRIKRSDGSLIERSADSVIIFEP